MYTCVVCAQGALSTSTLRSVGEGMGIAPQLGSMTCAETAVAHLKAAAQKACNPAGAIPALRSSEEHPKTVWVACSDTNVLPLLICRVNAGVLMLFWILLLLLLLS